MAPMIACPSVEQLSSFLRGQGDASHLADLGDHLESCLSCQERARTVVTEDTLLDRARGDFSRTDHLAHAVPATFVERLKSMARASSPSHESTVEVGGAADSKEADVDFLLPAQRPDEIGRLGPFRVLHVLGKGGMGMVFLAHDPRLDRQVALKVMLPRFAANETAKLRFLREARTAARVKSDHIVHIYEVEESRGVPYLAMELMEGKPLDQFLQTHPKLSIPQILQIARDTAKGLAAAHDKGLIHRDIKPGNLWLDQANAGRVKILDFGLARAEKEDVQMTQSGAIVGTPAYMAPEQARGNQPIDARADLFSLGCVLYRLCSGELPFKGETTMGMLLAIATEEPPLPTTYTPDLPPELSELIMQLLQKDPAKRPASAKAVITRLAEIDQKYRARATEASATAAVSLMPSPTKDSATISETRPAPAPPRRRPLVGTIAAALFGGAILLAGFVFFWQTPDGVVRIESNDDAIKIAFDGGELKIVGAYNEPLSLKPGQHGLKIKRDDFEFETDKLVVTKGDKITLKIEVLKGKMQLVQAGKGVLDAKDFPANENLAMEVPGKETFVLRLEKGANANLQKPGPVVEGAYTGEGWFFVEARSEAFLLSTTNLSLFLDPQGRLNLTSVQATSSPVPLETWMHVAMVSTGEEIRFYLNGKKAGTSVRKLNPITMKIGIGGSKFAGLAKEVRLSKVARYDEDFVPAQRFQSDRDTLMLFRCDEGKGDELTDSSGKGHHGKIIGAKWVKPEGSSIQTPGAPGEFALRVTREFGTKGVMLPDVKLDPNGPATIEAYCTHGDNQGSLVSIPRLSISSSPAKWALQAGAGIPGTKGHPFVRGQRTHLAAVRSGNTATLFVNGKQVDQLTGLDDRSKAAWSYVHLAWGLTGIIQEVRISKSARYEKDFTPLNRFEPDADTVALYHCDEGSGAKLVDASGNGYHGEILSGNWVKADGKPIPKTSPADDYALRIDTVTPKLAVEVERFLTDEHPNLTFETYCTPETQSYGSIVLTASLGLTIYSPPNKGPLWAFVGADTNQPFAPVIVGKRVHLAAVRTENGASLFVDGKLATQFGKVAKLAKLEPLLIGGPFKGTLDEIRISKVARYTKDFTPQPRFEPDADTLALYHCDEGSGDKLVDSSGNGRHGKVLAASWVKAEGMAAQPKSPPGDYALRFKYKFREKGAALPTLKFELDGPVTIEAYCTPEEFRQGMLFGGNTFGLGTFGNRWALANGAGLAAGKGPEIELGKTVHIAGVRTSEGAKLFVNGKLADQAPNGKVIPTTYFFLGSGFTGLIDELRVSKSARYDKDFTPEARFTPDKDTVALYHFDEGFGDVFEDSSGNGHHGRTENAIWAHADGSPVVAKPRDFALKFEGNGQVEVPKLNVATEKRITIEAFVKLHHSPEAGVVNLVGHGNLSSSLEDVRFHAQFGGTSTSNGNSSVAAGEDSKRIHVAAVLTDTELAIFWDGKKGATTPMTPRVQADIPAFLIGSLKFHGVLDEIRVSKTVRYTKNFAPQRRLESDADTLALYHCDEGEGDMLKDSSGNGHHGKIVGATWVYADGTPTVASAAFPPLDPAWLKAVAAMPADKQIEAVKTELMKRNPEFDGEMTPTVNKIDVVTDLRVMTNNVADLSPLQALTGLKKLNCNSSPRKSQLADLSPLKGMKLSELYFQHAEVSDLSPLKDMKLTKLGLGSTRVTDLSPLQGMPLESLHCFGTQVSDLSPLRGMPLTYLEITATPVASLAPLKDMKLDSLFFSNTKVADLSPLRGMPLTRLMFPITPVADLSPLKGMPLTMLVCNNTRVADLAPLKDMKLTTLNIGETNVSDLSPLKGMPLVQFHCNPTTVTDLSPLKDMPLKELGFDVKLDRDGAILRAMPTLEFINGKPASEVLKGNTTSSLPPLDPAWLKSVAAMKADEQVKAIVAELKNRNPDFEGNVKHRVDKDGFVSELQIFSGNVTDLLPVRVLPRLLSLGCNQSAKEKEKGNLVDLTPLKGMHLDNLHLQGQAVRDLSPLEGMQFRILDCQNTLVSDLTPLKKIDVELVWLNRTPLSNLSPLQGTKINKLDITQTKVTDLSPLAGSSLKHLYMQDIKVADLAPLKGMPLEYLMAEGTLVVDLTPLIGMPLKTLTLGKTRISDLEPLRGMPLRHLQVADTWVASLAPLQGLPLDTLYVQGTKVRDLTPLRGMPLRTLYCNFDAARDGAVLRSLKSLEHINGKLVSEVLP